jgi:hypothetical protein
MSTLNEPPMDGVVGGLSHVGLRDLSQDTLGGLLYTQALQNRTAPNGVYITIGESMYNAWLASME